MDEGKNSHVDEHGGDVFVLNSRQERMDEWIETN